jgi:hypothetical protein
VAAATAISVLAQTSDGATYPLTLDPAKSLLATKDDFFTATGIKLAQFRFKDAVLDDFDPVSVHDI